ncbi:MAG: 6-carboxytetrahydropterin synthase [Elusimicrobia bacterium]|nr:6-carboxytetrahydropterin synthase [Elusimicrobiota bacterium]
MIIRKLYRFEASHIVRNCSSERCKYSIHGHSFRVELFLTADRLDRGQMVYDFGLLKPRVGALIDGFDHAALFWERESAAYKRKIRSESRRWVQLPVSPTAEQLSRVVFVAAQALLDATDKVNGDGSARVHSVILHETETGYAQCFREDAYAAEFGEIRLDRIVWSPAVRKSWPDPRMWDALLRGRRFRNPPVEVQVRAA